MSRLTLLPGVADDIDRILEHLARYAVTESSTRVKEIVEAIAVLEHNPLIGRPVGDDKRELVIGRKSHGYLALYRYVAELDTVFVLALRSQREAGYSGL